MSLAIVFNELCLIGSLNKFHRSYGSRKCGSNRTVLVCQCVSSDLSLLFSEHGIDMIVPELRESLDIDLVGIEYD